MKGVKFGKGYIIALGTFAAQGGPSRAQAQGPRVALKRARAQALKRAQGGH